MDFDTAAPSAASMPVSTEKPIGGDGALPAGTPTNGNNTLGSSNKTHTSAFTPPSTSFTSLSRAGTLSWQQRPGSRGSTGTKARPLSLVAAENSASNSPKLIPDSVHVVEQEFSRDQIAQSLSSKDATWFKQTADRGIGSAAFRKSPDNTMMESRSTIGTMRLPGMSGESTAEEETVRGPQQETASSQPPSCNKSVPESAAIGQDLARTRPLSSSTSLSSPLPTLSAHRLAPPAEASSLQLTNNGYPRGYSMSPAQGRISPERMDRPSSPTKGYGSFVQSAMAIRSNSVNKRLSAQSNPGHSRGNSIARNRNAVDGSRHGGTGLSLPNEQFSSISREASPLSNSRPGSSHENSKDTLPNQSDEKSTVDSSGVSSNDGFVKPSLPNRTRSSSKDSSDQSTPSSPSRPIDSKKWSPMKTSWLESAISKADSPKLKPAPPQQPAWMAALSAAKLVRKNEELGKSTTSKEIAIGDLTRSSPLGANFKLPSPNHVSAFTTLTDPKTADASTPPNKAAATIEPRSHEPILTAQVKTGNLNIAIDAPKLSSDMAPSDAAAMEAVGYAKSQSSSPLTNPMAQKSPVFAKSKPTTPPKKDFRSTLKSRQVPVQSGQIDEPEFKNVFGKLKKAETKNYVAPDELKSNILRGKAGLALTDGPKKSERVDELKESILKKKEAMKTGGTLSTARKTSGNSIDRLSESPVPEAIAKRQTMARLGSSPSGGLTNTKDESIAPELTPRDVSIDPSPTFKPSEKKTSAPGRMQAETGPSGKLAARFNPALAGLLSRGPMSVAEGSSRAFTTSPTIIKEVNGNDTNDPTAGSSQLTHATKSRAKGPRRRLPTSMKSESTRNDHKEDANDPIHIELTRTTFPSVPKNQSVDPEHVAKVPLLPLFNITNQTINRQQNPPPSRPSQSLAMSNNDSDKQQPDITLSVVNAMTSPKPRVVTPSREASGALLEPAPRKSSTNIDRSRSMVSPPLSPESNSLVVISTSETPLDSSQDDQNHASVLDAAAQWQLSSNHTAQRPQRAKSPIKLPTRKDEEDAMRNAGLDERNAQNPIGLGIRTYPDNILKPPGRGLPTPPLKSPKSPPPRLSPKSPPLPAKKPDSIARVVSSSTLAAPLQETVSPSEPKISETTQLLAEFFDTTKVSKTKMNIDTHAILSSRSALTETGKIKTLRKQIWEVTSDGKKTPVPSQQEHILFEESMYLCTHVFGSPSGKRTTEVYLWSGDGVSPSAVEDAQLFSRNAAKETSGKLIILTQGKESSNFFEALGGIVITRRGSNSSGAAATYMLCGRRHMGQIAFDEVPFSVSSLCSGFPFIVSAISGRLYLWKGKGSGADELGCARLIGMDLGLTGEIEEIDEGKEPEAFWRAFPSRHEKRQESATHWQLKAASDKYATRLFRVELETRPKANTLSAMWGRRGSAPTVEEIPTPVIKEVSPYAQADLQETGIYVLDAFFEIFMFVFPLAYPLSHNTTL